MSDIRELWERTEAASSQNAPLPLGKNRSIIASAEFKDNPKGWKTIQWKLLFPEISDTCTRTKFTNINLEPESIARAKRDLKILGIPADFDSLEENLKSLAGTIIEVNVTAPKDPKYGQGIWFSKVTGRDRALTELSEAFGPVTVGSIKSEEDDLLS